MLKSYCTFQKSQHIVKISGCYFEYKTANFFSLLKLGHVHLDA